MADKNPTDEKTPEASGDKKPAAPQGIMPLLISTLLMAAVLGGVGFALAYFVLPARLQQTSAAAAPTSTTIASAIDPSAPIVKEETERSTAEAATQGNRVITKFTIEEVTVNIADTRGNRFVRAGVYFEAAPPVLEELEANRARMVDTLGQVLSTKTLDDLTSPDIRGNLRQELLGIINPTLKQGRVDNIYFTDLLVQ
jgi:flagellar protein FliL